MSDKSAALRATLKAGGGYDAPWLTVDAETPDELKQRLDAVATGEVFQSFVEASNALKAAYNLAPVLEHGQQAQAPSQQSVTYQQQQTPGWGQPTQQQAPPPQQQGNGARLHPEGKPCGLCGSVLQFKQVNRKSDGRQFKFWTCPNQQNRDDGHATEFAN